MKLGVTGHQNIPPRGLESIHSGLVKLLETRPIEAGLSSLAKGADQLFASCVLEAGYPLWAIVPCRDYELTFSGEDLQRYRKQLHAASVVQILDFDGPTEEAFMAAGNRIVELSDLLVAVWDGRAAQGKGGTADVVAYAAKLGTPTEIFWPPGLRRG